MSEFNFTRQFLSTPFWLFIEIDETNGSIKIDEIPLSLDIGKFKYKFLYSIR